MSLDSRSLPVERVVLGAGKGALAACETALERGSDGLDGLDALGRSSGCSCREHVGLCIVWLFVSCMYLYAPRRCGFIVYCCHFEYLHLETRVELFRP